MHVGKSKDSLDLVDFTLTISDVAGVFGNFVKFTVEDPEEPETVRAGELPLA